MNRPPKALSSSSPSHLYGMAAIEMFRRLLRRRSRYVVHAGLLLPPRHLRYNGPRFRDDQFFLDSAVLEAERLIRRLGLNSASAVLEIGCGPGRLPIGILARLGEIGWYQGVDIDARSIAWCRTYISRYHPSFCFETVDARHERYNPGGKPMGDGFSLPFPADSFDVVYLHSVFANMLENDVRIYASEFRRLLKPSGKVFLTAFLEENVPPVTVNPADYKVACQGVLHVARYERRYFCRLLEEAGLQVQGFEYGTELDGQSGVYLGLRGEGSAL